MSFEITITLNTANIENEIETRFGVDSPAQEEWKWIVFDGSAPYCSFDTGRFLINSEQETKYASKDEIVYVSPPEYNYPYLPMFLWTGQSKHGAIIIQNYTASTNVLAGGMWVIRASNDRYPEWVRMLQEMVNNGKV